MDVAMRRMCGLICWTLLAGMEARAQTHEISLEPLISNLAGPVLLTNAHDGTNRRFILEQAGRILVMQPESSTAAVFLDISGRVLSGGERGLLGLAFHPQFSSNRRFFVNYTRQPDGATVVAEYLTSETSPDKGEPASELVLLVIPQPFANHNGGMIEFGADNFLYIGMGDGGAGNDPQNRAQNLNDLLGKMLRIDIDHPESALIPYSSPGSNPFWGAIPGRDEIFALGFRNPWRFSFDRFDGRLFAGDVGQGAREEIDIVRASGNYGWRVFEGTLCTNLDPLSCLRPDFTPPITEYVNNAQGRCAIIGGYVYRGARSSLPYGAYIFGDLCSGEIFMFHKGVQSVLLDTTESISSFGEDEAGELYVVGLGGSINRIRAAGASANSQLRISLPGGGGAYAPLAVPGPVLATGYTVIQSDPGGTPLDSLAVFQKRQDGIIVSESTVAAKPLLRSGRILAAAGESGTTGIAVANPNTTAATVDFYFTDSSGVNFGQRTIIIPAGGQISAFLNGTPFLGGPAIDGTFTFSSSNPIAVMAIRGLTNYRSAFIFSSLPIAPIDNESPAPSVFPHWARGAGWTTDFALVNPSEQGISGELRLYAADGGLESIHLYAIPPRSAQKISPPGGQESVRTGFARIIPSISPAPFGMAIFRSSTAAGTVVEASVPAVAGGTSSRFYGEHSAAANTGLAIANLSSVPSTVTIELTSLDGTAYGQPGTLLLPPDGQRSLFLSEIPGLPSIDDAFQGVVRLTSTAPVAATSFKCRINQSGDFLIAAGPAITEDAGISTYIPQIALGDGYEMQIGLFNLQSTAQTAILTFFDPKGQPLPVFTNSP